MKYLLAVMLILTSGVAHAQSCCPTPAECPNPKCECEPCQCESECNCGEPCPFEVSVTVVDPAQQAYEYFNMLNEQRAMEVLQLHNTVVQLGQRGMLQPDTKQQYMIAQQIMKKIADSAIGATILAKSGDAEDKLRAAADLAGTLKQWAIPKQMFTNLIKSAKPPAPPKRSET